ncbi:MAG: hypothetical protein J6Z82_09360 [Schwartzia sp.]|nr:hypothetical protein [Schwartzia sp. (in: firmicutes)]
MRKIFSGVKILFKVVRNFHRAKAGCCEESLAALAFGKRKRGSDTYFPIAKFGEKNLRSGINRRVFPPCAKERTVFQEARAEPKKKALRRQGFRLTAKVNHCIISARQRRRSVSGRRFLHSSVVMAVAE